MGWPDIHLLAREQGGLVAAMIDVSQLGCLKKPMSLVLAPGLFFSSCNFQTVRRKLRGSDLESDLCFWCYSTVAALRPVIVS
jgi:hypothetical protein